MFDDDEVEAAGAAEAGGVEVDEDVIAKVDMGEGVAADGE
jgi:hypothetical protein